MKDLKTGWPPSDGRGPRHGKTWVRKKSIWTTCARSLYSDSSYIRARGRPAVSHQKASSESKVSVYIDHKLAVVTTKIVVRSLCTLVRISKMLGRVIWEVDIVGYVSLLLLRPVCCVRDPNGDNSPLLIPSCPRLLEKCSSRPWTYFRVRTWRWLSELCDMSHSSSG